MGMPRIGTLLAMFAAGGLVVGSVLPMADSASAGYRAVAQNSLIQHGGWITVAIAIAIGLAAARPVTSRTQAAVFILGVVAAFAAYHYGTDHSALTLYPVDGNGNPDTSLPGSTAKPGIGIWITGMAGGVAILASLLMQQDAEQPAHATPSPPAEGWFEDPDGEQQLRWWDGSQWTRATKAIEP